jgi:hypothetical protein
VALARVVERRNPFSFFSSNLKVGDLVEVLGMGGRIVLECILNNQAGGGCELE